MIYLDHAATSYPKPPVVVDAVTRVVEMLPRSKTLAKTLHHSIRCVWPKCPIMKV